MNRRGFPSIVKLRPDIEWVYYPEQRRWVAKDPISSCFYYFSESDYAIAQRLDGTRTFSEILASGQPLGRRLTQRWLNNFVRSLAKSRLLQTSSLAPNRRESTKLGSIGILLLQTLISPLSIRIPVFRPTGQSSLLKLLASVLFHRSLVLVASVSTIVCGWLVLNSVLAEPERLIYEVSRIQGDRWLLIFLVYLSVKLLHEFGHWLACIKWNANCREIGILLLCFTPCLYCDITDSWKLASKWRRAAIAAAGIYVELLLAIVAAIVWLNTHSDLLRLLAGSVIVTCTIGTVLVNGNPCFKYDGYYILSDLWGVPNLYQQSSRALWRVFLFALGGSEVNRTDQHGNQWSLAAFALVSGIYRAAFLVLLIWLAWLVLEPIGLGLLAVFLIVPILATKVLAIGRFFGSIILELNSRRGLSSSRLIALVAIVLISGYAAFNIPIANSVRARGVVTFANKRPLFVSRTSMVGQNGLMRQQITQGDLLLELRSPDLELEMLEIEHEIELLKSKIELLRQAAVLDPVANYEIPTAQELLNEYQARLKLLQPERDTLTLIANDRGRLIPSHLRVQTPIAVPVDVRRANSPLALSNQGCTVERGETLGWFVTDERIAIESIVSEQDIQSLSINMPAECLLDAAPFDRISGHVARISIEPIESVPDELIGDPMIVITRDKDGRTVPETPHYRVTMHIADQIDRPFLGSLASVRFTAPKRTLWELVYQYFWSIMPTNSGQQK